MKLNYSQEQINHSIKEDSPSWPALRYQKVEARHRASPSAQLLPGRTPLCFGPEF